MLIEENVAEDIFAALERLHYKKRNKNHASEENSGSRSERDRRKKLSNLLLHRKYGNKCP